MPARRISEDDSAVKMRTADRVLGICLALMLFSTGGIAGYSKVIGFGFPPKIAPPIESGGGESMPIMGSGNPAPEDSMPVATGGGGVVLSGRGNLLMTTLGPALRLEDGMVIDITGVHILLQ